MTFLKGGTWHSSRHGEKQGIKIGKIQTREFMSRPEIAEKVIVLEISPQLEFFKEAIWARSVLGPDVVNV